MSELKETQQEHVSFALNVTGIEEHRLLAILILFKNVQYAPPVADGKGNHRHGCGIKAATRMRERKRRKAKQSSFLTPFDSKFLELEKIAFDG